MFLSPFMRRPPCVGSGSGLAAYWIDGACRGLIKATLCRAGALPQSAVTPSTRRSRTGAHHWRRRGECLFGHGVADAHVHARAPTILLIWSGSACRRVFPADGS